MCVCVCVCICFPADKRVEWLSYVKCICVPVCLVVSNSLQPHGL